MFVLLKGNVMLNVHYDPNSINVYHAYQDLYSTRDTFMEYILSRALSDDVYDITISTETTVMAIQCAIAEERLPWDRLLFFFNHTLVPHNQYGRFENPPKGFLDVGYTLAYRTLRAAINKYRSNKIESGVSTSL
jgi:hypothetical protein